MSSSKLPEDIIEFTYAEDPVKPGEWTWRVMDNKREVVVSCPTCANQMRIAARFSVASDGLIGSLGGRGFTCGGRPKGCPVQGRFMLVDYHAHLKMVH